MKILVVQIGRYGDLILTTPLLQALREHYVSAEIHVLASARNHDLLEHQTLVDVVHVYRKNPLDMMQSFHALRSERFDIMIDPKDHYSQESTFFTRVIRADVSIGFNSPTKQVFSHSLPSASENDAHDPPLHAVDRNLNPLKFLGIEVHNRLPRLEWSRLLMNQSFDILPNPKPRQKTIVLNISAGQKERQWQTEKWISLGRSLAKSDRRIVVLAAPDDHIDAQRIASEIGIKSLVNHPIKQVPADTAARTYLYKTSTIHEGIVVISRADLLVTPDSAPVHIASSFDTPCVALFNSIAWNLHKFRPLSSINHVIQPDMSSGEVKDIDVRPVLEATEDALIRIPPAQK